MSDNFSDNLVFVDESGPVGMSILRSDQPNRAYKGGREISYQPWWQAVGIGVEMQPVENKRPRRNRRGQLPTGNPQSKDFVQPSPLAGRCTKELSALHFGKHKDFFRGQTRGLRHRITVPVALYMWISKALSEIHPKSSLRSQQHFATLNR